MGRPSARGKGNDQMSIDQMTKECPNDNSPCGEAATLSGPLIWSLVILWSLVIGHRSFAQTPSGFPAELTNGVSWIDLPTALRLAGAHNLDVRIAREKLAEARAN